MHTILTKALLICPKSICRWVLNSLVIYTPVTLRHDRDKCSIINIGDFNRFIHWFQSRDSSRYTCLWTLYPLPLVCFDICDTLNPGIYKIVKFNSVHVQIDVSNVADRSEIDKTDIYQLFKSVIVDLYIYLGYFSIAFFNACQSCLANILILLEGYYNVIRRM